MTGIAIHLNLECCTEALPSSATVTAYGPKGIVSPVRGLSRVRSPFHASCATIILGEAQGRNPKQGMPMTERLPRVIPLGSADRDDRQQQHPEMCGPNI